MRLASGKGERVARRTACFVYGYALLHASLLGGSGIELRLELGVKGLHVFEATFGIPCWSRSVRIATQIYDLARGSIVNGILGVGGLKDMQI
jgi:hypothetical protein